MIIRVFKAKIPEVLHEEFEAKFKEISAPAVKQFDGLISLEIGLPTHWNPEECIMISRWISQKDIIAFAGDDWNQAYIPEGMEKFVADVSLSHYEEISLK